MKIKYEFAGGMSIREITRQKGTNFRIVHESVESGRKKFKNFIKNTLSKQIPNLCIVKGITSCFFLKSHPRHKM